MSTDQRENLRVLILTAMERSGPYAVTLPALRANLPREFRGLEVCDLLAEVAYLMDKGLVQEEPKVLSPENKAWRISAAGRDFLAMEGLA